MNKQNINRESISGSISALADGQLAGSAFSRTVDLIQADVDARRTWQAYHLVGDVLRSNDLARCTLGDGFVSKLQARLAQEPALSAPPVAAVAALAPKSSKPLQMQPFAAANDSVFRWKLVASFASLVAVGAVGWSLLGSVGAGNSSAPVLASASPTNSTASTAIFDNTAVMIRDPNLDALLAAHKQYGSGNALQGSTGFLRNATFESSGR